MHTRRLALGIFTALALASCAPAEQPPAPPGGCSCPSQETTVSDHQLLRAADAGDIGAVRAALGAGANVEARDEHRRTPLLLAALGDHVDVARELVRAGADPDAQDDRRDTPFLVTGVTGSVGMLETLLPADPDLALTNRYGGTALIPAGEHAHVEYLRAAVRTGIDVDHVNDLGWTALLEAVVLGDGGPRHQQAVQALLDGGADPSIPDRDGVTALQHAERDGHTDLARILRST
ncbi:ankyrin repeat domain-containing protein [Saccharopolyspora sp. ID03-671]|uniref:ankyrin repeat domain-containing protein n=1 Tax=Saccharopolyspora sp. ID03-671 TaxID=3073066 RepID=UPI00324843DC